MSRKERMPRPGIEGGASYRPRLVLGDELRAGLESRFDQRRLERIEKKIEDFNEGKGKLKMLVHETGPDGNKAISVRVSRDVRILAEIDPEDRSKAIIYDVIWRREL